MQKLENEPSTSHESEDEQPDGPIENAWAIKIPDFKKGDMKHSLLEESSFSVLFPRYREKYLKECWPLLQKTLQVCFINAYIIIYNVS